MDIDRSEGWDSIADRFIAVRSDIGAALVTRWARANLSRGATLVDLGCGSGVPVAMALATAGFDVSGIDASPTMIDAFRRNLPDAPWACEPVQGSGFFGRRFDAAIAIGLIFLLPEADQEEAIRRIAGALLPGGRLLFSAPRERCNWQDMLTGRRSLSLGEARYAALLEAAGLRLIGRLADEGDNHYFDAEAIRVDRASRHIAAAPDRIYRALTDRDLVGRWLPPEGARGVIEAFDPRPGGAFRMTLIFETQGGPGTGKSTPDTDVVEGAFVDFVPNRLVRQRFTFASGDPAFAGEMVMTWTLTPADDGTDVAIAAQGVPDGIAPKDHEAGMASSLANLAALVE